MSKDPATKKAQIKTTQRASDILASYGKVLFSKHRVDYKHIYHVKKQI